MSATVRWVTVALASELTGFTEEFFAEHSRGGLWIEGKVWKWVQGRRLFDMVALYDWIDQQPSIPTKRGRKPKAEQGEVIDV